MGYHIVGAKKTLEKKEAVPGISYWDIISSKSNMIPPAERWCFSNFEEFYPAFSDGETVFTTLILSKKAERLIEDLNATFAGIKISILSRSSLNKCSVMKGEHVSDTYINQFFETHINRTLRGALHTLELCTFGISFYRSYAPSSQFYLYVPIAEFIRLLDPYPGYAHYEKLQNVFPSVRNMLEAINKNTREEFNEYGSWCNFPVSYEQFMIMNDPAAVNRVFGHSVFERHSSSYYPSYVMKNLIQSVKETENGK